MSAGRPSQGGHAGRHGRASAGSGERGVIARLRAARADLEPDPLFRRRLRGEVVNRHVARREGLARSPRPRREMGRLGRATLYASVGLAVSVTAAGAAAQEALPGDALYPVKLRLEEIRMRVAPASLHDDLAVLALDERLDELEQLAQAGAWSRVSTAVSLVAEAESRVAGYGAVPDGIVGGEVHRHVAVIQQLLLTAPEAARAGLRTALEASGGPAASEPGGEPPAGAGGGKKQPREVDAPGGRGASRASPTQEWATPSGEPTPRRSGDPAASAAATPAPPEPSPLPRSGDESPEPGQDD